MLKIGRGLCALAFAVAEIPPSLRGEAAADGSACPVAGRVAVVGDSISDQARNVTIWTLTMAGYEVVAYDAAWLRRTAVDNALLDNTVSSGVDTTRAVASEFNVDCWVIALGTNDVEVADSGRYAGDITELMRSVPQDDLVFWVGVGIGEHAYTAKPGALWRAAAFNQTLLDLATRWPQLTYVDFATAAASPDIVDFDGVHLGLLGRQVRADLIVGALVAPLPQQFENASKSTHPCGSGR